MKENENLINTRLYYSPTITLLSTHSSLRHPRDALFELHEIFGVWSFFRASCHLDAECFEMPERIIVRFRAIELGHHSSDASVVDLDSGPEGSRGDCCWTRHQQLLMSIWTKQTPSKRSYVCVRVCKRLFSRPIIPTRLVSNRPARQSGIEKLYYVRVSLGVRRPLVESYKPNSSCSELRPGTASSTSLVSSLLLSKDDASSFGTAWRPGVSV